MRPERTQRGVALITAILLVAIATLLAAKLSWDNQVSMRRTETTLMQEQARLFALAAEAVAIDLLSQDDNAYDIQNDPEDWTSPQYNPIRYVIDIDDLLLGEVTGFINDEQGKLNVNNLINVDGEVDPVARGQFERLFRNLRVDESLVGALVDWIDADTVPQTGGGEDGTYSALDPGYRPANSYMTSISELRAIVGIDEQIYATLLPHVTAFPPEWCGVGATPVNVNFATPEVMGSLHPDMNLGDGQVLMEERGESGWEDKADIAGIDPDLRQQIDSFITVKSDCLRLNVIVTVGSSVLTMYSLLDRSGGDDKIIARNRAFGLD